MIVAENGNVSYCLIFPAGRDSARHIAISLSSHSTWRDTRFRCLALEHLRRRNGLRSDFNGEKLVMSLLTSIGYYLFPEYGDLFIYRKSVTSKRDFCQALEDLVVSQSTMDIVGRVSVAPW